MSCYYTPYPMSKVIRCFTNPVSCNWVPSPTISMVQSVLSNALSNDIELPKALVSNSLIQTEARYPFQIVAKRTIASTEPL